MIEHNITKAKRSFFAYGSIGTHEGTISPLSCRSVIETCIMPILLYGCECWYLCDSSLKAFLGELCKREHCVYLSSRTLAALSDDIESVRECLELKERLNVNFTHSLLTSQTDLDMPSVTQIKKQTPSNSLSLLLGKEDT